MYHKLNNENSVVRICKDDVCIEANGENARLLVVGVVFFFVCLGLAELTKNN